MSMVRPIQSHGSYQSYDGQCQFGTDSLELATTLPLKAHQLDSHANGAQIVAAQ